ncbi:MAG TPA: 2-phosphosulfolactate phosphatase [Tepidisphaeraceae bacterium]|jgi:2-phosphosulfolactate phosphatase|nr:2-phosphosulfolactate phosphatase [Tepidisphaeraceae bacterium]
MFAEQSEFNIRCEWGERGVAALAPISDVVIIVDVLSFCTCVDIAVSRGAMVYPFAWKDERATAFAAEKKAHLAKGRGSGGYSLSPASLVSIEAGARLVLPSPNGSALTQRTGKTPTLAGCLRNASAVAQAATQIGQNIAVIPAGERWPDHSLRPAIEDWIGAGAIIAELTGIRSPEAQLAAGAFASSISNLGEIISRSASGKELIGKGFSEDVRLACELNISTFTPGYCDEAYRVRG